MRVYDLATLEEVQTRGTQWPGSVFLAKGTYNLAIRHTTQSGFDHSFNGPEIRLALAVTRRGWTQMPAKPWPDVTYQRVTWRVQGSILITHDLGTELYIMEGHSGVTAFFMGTTFSIPIGPHSIMCPTAVSLAKSHLKRVYDNVFRPKKPKPSKGNRFDLIG